MPTQEERGMIFPTPEKNDEEKKEIKALEDKIESLDAKLKTEEQKEISALKKWANDLQSWMYINCVYCGHRYGTDPGIRAAMADVFKEHNEKCPKHPLPEARWEIAMLNKERAAAFQRWKDAIAKYPNGADGCCCLFDKDQNQIGWCSVHAEPRDEIAALKKEAQDLHDKYGKLWDENALLKADIVTRFFS